MTTETTNPVAIFKQIAAHGGHLPEVGEIANAAGHVLRTMLGRTGRGQLATDREVGLLPGTTHLLTNGQTTGEAGLDAWCAVLGLLGAKNARKFLSGDQWAKRVLEALVLLDMFGDEDGFERSLRASGIEHHRLADEMYQWRTLSTLSTASVRLLAHRYNYDHRRDENAQAWCDMMGDYRTLTGRDDEEEDGEDA